MFEPKRKPERYVNPMNQLAYENGCKRPYSWSHKSSQVYPKAWISHACLDRLSSRLISKKYTGVVHYTLKSCILDPVQKCLCIVRERKTKGTEQRWALDGIHKVGKCPHCEYKDERR